MASERADLVAANDEPGQAYKLRDWRRRIVLQVDHQSFDIGPEFDDTDEGRQEREWFKSMIHVALRRLVERASTLRATEEGTG